MEEGRHLGVEVFVYLYFVPYFVRRGSILIVLCCNGFGVSPSPRFFHLVIPTKKGSEPQPAAEA